MKERIKKIYQEEWSYSKAQILKPALLCMIGFLLASIIYYQTSMQDMSAAQEFYSKIGQAFEEKGMLSRATSIKLFWLIFANNITAGFFILMAGIIPFVFLPFWVVIFNAALAGIVIAVSRNAGASLAQMVLSLLPHGVIELPALFFTAGLGIRLCLDLTKKIIGRGENVNLPDVFRRVIRSFLLVALPLFLLAAFIEAFVTAAIVK